MKMERILLMAIFFYRFVEDDTALPVYKTKESKGVDYLAVTQLIQKMQEASNQNEKGDELHLSEKLKRFNAKANLTKNNKTNPKSPSEASPQDQNFDSKSNSVSPLPNPDPDEPTELAKKKK